MVQRGDLVSEAKAELCWVMLGCAGKSNEAMLVAEAGQVVGIIE